MKKILSIALAAIMLMALLSVNVFAYSDNVALQVQVYAQPHSDWSWHSCGYTLIPLGQTASIPANDRFVFDNLDCSSGISFAIQFVDANLSEDGESSHMDFDVSNIIIKADGYDDYVIPAQHIAADPVAKAESWGLSGNGYDLHFDLAAITGTDDASVWSDYLTAVTEFVFEVTYAAYNGVDADGNAYGAASAPAEDEPTVEPVDDTPAAPVVETPAAPAEATTSAPAKTGVVLAVLPMAVAAAAVALTKKR